jgi:hypothetical protein
MLENEQRIVSSMQSGYFWLLSPSDNKLGCAAEVCMGKLFHFLLREYIIFCLLLNEMKKFSRYITEKNNAKNAEFKNNFSQEIWNF